jgi:hypothetical protein
MRYLGIPRYNTDELLMVLTNRYRETSNLGTTVRSIGPNKKSLMRRGDMYLEIGYG